MKSKDEQKQRDPLGAILRRDSLRGSAALAMTQSVTALAQPAKVQGGSGRGGSSLAYVGCYTPNGQGVYLFSVNSHTGALTQLKVFQSTATPPVSTTNPSWLAFDPQKKYLYAGNEISNFGSPPNTTGAVSAFAIDKSNGDLTFLNTVSSGGRGLPI
jgi:6-phosphogluconolactonase